MELRMKTERTSRDGWTQEYVGKAVGVTREAISQIENGVIDPSLGVLRKLEALFGMDHKDLLAPVTTQPEEDHTR